MRILYRWRTWCIVSVLFLVAGVFACVCLGWAMSEVVACWSLEATVVTAIFVYAYLRETAMIRESADEARYPLLVVQFGEVADHSSYARACGRGPDATTPCVVLRNLGGGPAVNIRLRWLGFEAVNDPKVQVPYREFVAAISAAPVGQSRIADYLAVTANPCGTVLVSCELPTRVGTTFAEYEWARDASSDDGFRLVRHTMTGANQANHGVTGRFAQQR